MRVAFFALLCLALPLLVCGVDVANWATTKPPYPDVKRVDVSFTYPSAANGTVTVPDPYNWLETPAAQSDEVQQFVSAQSNFTQQAIDGCPDLDSIGKRFNTTLNYTHFTLPAAIGDRNSPKYYYSVNLGLNPRSTIYVAEYADLIVAEQTNYSNPTPGKEFFDVNLLSTDGSVSVTSFAHSRKDVYLAYCVTINGSDWETVYFRNTSKPFVDPVSDPQEAAKGGPDRLPDVLVNVRGGVSWTTKERGVYYEKVPGNVTAEQLGIQTEVLTGSQIYFHYMNTTQEDDILIVANDTVEAFNTWGAFVTNDGKYLVISSENGDGNTTRLYMAPNQTISSNMSFFSVAPTFSYSLSYVANDNETFYFVTNKDAPNYKLVKTQVDPSKARPVAGQLIQLSDECTYEDVIPENDKWVMTDASVYDTDKLLVTYQVDVQDQLYQYELQTGTLVQRLLPDFVGTILDMKGRRHSQDVFVSIGSLTTPQTIYRLFYADNGTDCRALPTTQLHRSSKVPLMDLSLLTDKQVFVPSQGGANISVFLAHRTDAKFDGTGSAYIYFYGAHGITTQPTFDVVTISWAYFYGGTIVLVNARGGGEYGDSFHDAGRLLNKKNTFYDVLSAAQFLVDQKIAARGKIILRGGSSSGMSALAITNMAPEGLLGMTISSSPLTDMLRFQTATAGIEWVQEYGNSSDPVQFDYLYSYSPLHNVNASKVYPFVLISTGDSDDRVESWHGRKMISELQYKLPNNPSPLLLRTIKNSGHTGASTTTRIQTASFNFCMMSQFFGIEQLPSTVSNSSA